jgi:hypothetical protein
LGGILGVVLLVLEGLEWNEKIELWLLVEKA